MSINSDSVDKTNKAISQFLDDDNQAKTDKTKKYLVITGHGASEHLECRTLWFFERWAKRLTSTSLGLGSASIERVAEFCEHHRAQGVDDSKLKRTYTRYVRKQVIEALDQTLNHNTVEKMVAIVQKFAPSQLNVVEGSGAESAAQAKKNDQLTTQFFNTLLADPLQANAEERFVLALRLPEEERKAALDLRTLQTIAKQRKLTASEKEALKPLLNNVGAKRNAILFELLWSDLSRKQKESFIPFFYRNPQVATRLLQRLAKANQLTLAAGDHILCRNLLFAANTSQIAELLRAIAALPEKTCDLFVKGLFSEIKKLEPTQKTTLYHSFDEIVRSSTDASQLDSGHLDPNNPVDAMLRRRIDAILSQPIQPKTVKPFDVEG